MKNYMGSLPGFVLLSGLDGPDVVQSLPPLPGEDVAPVATGVPNPLRSPELAGLPPVAKPSVPGSGKKAIRWWLRENPAGLRWGNPGAGKYSRNRN